MEARVGVIQSGGIGSDETEAVRTGGGWVGHGGCAELAVLDKE